MDDGAWLHYRLLEDECMGKTRTDGGCVSKIGNTGGYIGKI